MGKYILNIFLVAISSILFAEVPNLQNTQIVKGFAGKISGDDFSYHSSIPLAKECLIIRATDGNSSM